MQGFFVCFHDARMANAAWGSKFSGACPGCSLQTCCGLTLAGWGVWGPLGVCLGVLKAMWGYFCIQLWEQLGLWARSTSQRYSPRACCAARGAQRLQARVRLMTSDSLKDLKLGQNFFCWWGQFHAMTKIFSFQPVNTSSPKEHNRVEKLLLFFPVPFIYINSVTSTLQTLLHPDEMNLYVHISPWCRRTLSWSGRSWCYPFGWNSHVSNCIMWAGLSLITRVWSIAWRCSNAEQFAGTG